jgi:ribonuclease HII
MDFFYDFDNNLEAGCDEAGRGSLSGPVVAAAVIFDKKYKNKFINDSKQLSENQRNELRLVIENEALTWGVGFVYQDEIDKINILNASILAMHRALDKLSKIPDFILVDGNKFKPYRRIPFKTIVKGDSKYLSIAAASILAKTHRDEYMIKLHNEFPQYDWKNNKGYPTLKHRKAISEFGISIHHRKTFNLLPPRQMKLDL